MQITGNSLFTCLTRKNTKGKMPSNAYEVGVEIDDDFSISKTANDKEQDWLTDYINEHTKDIKYKGKDGKEVDKSIFKISNARFPIPLFDENAVPMERAVPIPNGTSITLELEKKFSDEFNKDYLVVKAVKLNQHIEEYNPFAK